MIIRFRTRTVYETIGPNSGPVFEAGSEHEMSDDRARRWIRRGVAEAIDAFTALAPAADVPPAPPVTPARRGRPPK
jgi:hypothetical protein